MMEYQVERSYWTGAMMLMVAACSADSPSIIEMQFGTTDWVWNSDKPASDYIASFGKKIPEAAKICHVTLLGYDGGISDGGEAAYFQPRPDDESAQKCLARIFPKGNFGIVPSEEWEERKRTIPGFPRSLKEVDEQIDLLPPEIGDQEGAT
jgi:hypothetical protein